MGNVYGAGSCLCGAVRYVAYAPLRDVIVCHCADCRRWHGTACAMTAVRRDALEIADADALRWYTKPDSQPLPARGFCVRCGASVFWSAPERETVTIAAGTLDLPTGLRTSGHIFVSHVGDYELLGDDLPQYSGPPPTNVAAAPESGS